MQVIIGLGNPGSQYERTRHNAGFLAVDAVAQRLGLRWERVQRVQADIAKDRNYLLVKPQAYMNTSGQSARAAITYFAKKSKGASGRQSALNPQQVLVAFDDLDLELGSFKLQFGKGPKVHNGLLSVYEHLGTSQLWHLRLGVDGRKGDRSEPGSAYVLKQFLPEEQHTVQQMVEDAVRRALQPWDAQFTSSN